MLPPPGCGLPPPAGKIVPRLRSAPNTAAAFPETAPSACCRRSVCPAPMPSSHIRRCHRDHPNPPQTRPAGGAARSERGHPASAPPPAPAFLQTAAGVPGSIPGKSAPDNRFRPPAPMGWDAARSAPGHPPPGLADLGEPAAFCFLRRDGCCRTDQSLSPCRWILPADTPPCPGLPRWSPRAAVPGRGHSAAWFCRCPCPR